MSYNFTEKLLAERFDTVVYLTSEENSIPTFFYVAIKGTEFKNFRKFMDENKMDLKKIGARIIQSGFGEPTYDLRQLMLKEYGCNSETALKIKPNILETV